MQKSEFELGFEATKKKHPSLDKTLAWNFITRFDRLYVENKERPVLKRQKFGLLMRLALNEVSIADPDERKRYASVASAIYQARKTYHPKSKRSGAAQQTAPPYDVVMDDKGQQGWKL